MANLCWKQFELTITEPPCYRGHFELIKNHIIPFVEKIGARFWITNYYSRSEDFILFRSEVDEEQLKNTIDFLDSLVKRQEIVRWVESDWSPEDDARTRIISANQKFGLPSPDIALSTLEGTQKVPLTERVEQLGSIFANAVGSCTKTLYKTLKSKPTDPWMISLFIHLVLNSLDISGPNPQSEEDCIRRTPVF